MSDTSQPFDAERIARNRALIEKATPGPWDAEAKGNSVESAQIVITDPNNRKICDTFNADDQEIHTESDEDGVYYFEGGQRRHDMEFIAAARTEFPAALDALEAAQKRSDYLRDELDAVRQVNATLRQDWGIERTHATKLGQACEEQRQRAEAAQVEIERLKAELAEAQKIRNRYIDPISGAEYSKGGA